MQDIDITQIVAVLIGLLSVLVTSVIVPLIRTKLTNIQWETVKNYALAGVQAAEILFDAQGKGEEKLEWVSSYIESQCQKHGIKIDMDTIRIAIENAWKDLGLDTKHRTKEAVEWLAKYWLEALFSGILTGLSFIVKMMWNRQKQEDRRQKAIELGIQALLRDRVVQAYYHYTERGWITLHGLEAAEKMYTEYHNLGGNGTVTKLMEDLRELPVKDRVSVLKGKMSPTD